MLKLVGGVDVGGVCVNVTTKQRPAGARRDAKDDAPKRGAKERGSRRAKRQRTAVREGERERKGRQSQDDGSGRRIVTKEMQ